MRVLGELKNNGNLGIGTTSPLQKLHVQGLCVTGDTLLPVIRREGIATLAPLARNDEEVGESSRQDREVSGLATHNYLPNTPINAKNMGTREVLTPQTREMESVKIEYIPIVQVRPGDHVLSLNEEKGKIEPHRINGLLDMGVEPVFRLTTESGRTIRTTGNHPYLVKVARPQGRR